MKVLQINSTKNSGSTGRIAEGIGQKLLAQGNESYIAYGCSLNPGTSVAIKIGNRFDQLFHVLNTRIFDTHGLHSTKATNHLIRQIENIQPDIIHLHNLHGYYLNIEVLFKYIKKLNVPIIWTLHDSWAFTGHCCYYERVQCHKWKTECNQCPLKFLYPRSYVFDNSKNNFHKKKDIFCLPDNLFLITVSKWLENQVKLSFLKNRQVKTIYNGVDLSVFKPQEMRSLKLKHGFMDKNVILGVANVWSGGKGLSTFLKLSKIIRSNQIIILIGLNRKQLKMLPVNIIGIERTEKVSELAEYYNIADVFVNPSIAETFGMVTAEAMSCGTPSVVYNSTAMPELINEEVGFVVEPNDLQSLYEKINEVILNGKQLYADNCRKQAEILFNKEKQFEEYLTFYQAVLNNHNTKP